VLSRADPGPFSTKLDAPQIYYPTPVHHASQNLFTIPRDPELRLPISFLTAEHTSSHTWTSVQLDQELCSGPIIVVSLLAKSITCSWRTWTISIHYQNCSSHHVNLGSVPNEIYTFSRSITCCTYTLLPPHECDALSQLLLVCSCDQTML
jgi:hypothetical protein